MQNKFVIVTGGSGKAGKWIIAELLEHGYRVLNLDIKQPEKRLCDTLIVDLNDLGQVHNALSQYGNFHQLRAEAIIHFAAIPCPFIYPNDITFKNNVMSTYNIMEAAANLGIRKVVSASSESSYGLCFAKDMFSPSYLPVDEEHPQLPEDSYGLSKVVNEQTADAFYRRTGMQIISFRLGNILEEQDYSALKDVFEHQPEQRIRNLWSYIDVRDVASACRLAIETEGLGAQHVILAANDTSSSMPSKQLIERFFPDVADLRSSFENRTGLLSNSKAKQLLGWKQQHYWKEYV